MYLDVISTDFKLIICLSLTLLSSKSKESKDVMAVQSYGHTRHFFQALSSAKEIGVLHCPQDAVVSQIRLGQRWAPAATEVSLETQTATKNPTTVILGRNQNDRSSKRVKVHIIYWDVCHHLWYIQNNSLHNFSAVWITVVY